MKPKLEQHSESDPLWQHTPAVHQALFRPLDLAVRVSATDRRLIDMAALVLGAPVEAPGGHVGSEVSDRPDFAVQSGDRLTDELAAGDQPPSRPEMTMVLVAGADPGVTARAAGRSAHRERGQLYAATVEGVGVTVADLAMGTAAVFVEMEQMAGVTAGEVPVRPAEVLIGSPVWRFAASKGLVALHAGAVTGELGTVVVRGPAGRGKSTAVLAAGQAGWSVLADETVWFDPLLDPPVLRATGMPIQIEREDGSKGPLDAGPLTPTRFCTVAPLGCTVFLAPRERHGAGSWHPLDADSALAAFAAGAHPGEGTQARERIARARSALLSGGCYELVAGSPDTLADQLTAIASHARRPAHAQGPGPSR